MEESITLVYKEDRISVNKERLAKKSIYFSSLFSHNFKDSRNTEHVFNYDNISFRTLENFVEWIHDDVYVNLHTGAIKASLRKFIKHNTDYTQLLELLELSCLYVADELIDEIVEIIILYWFSPVHIIDIWLLAQDLNLKALKDMCFCFCLDRFEELPILSFCKLSKDNFTSIISNVNIRSSLEHLNVVKNEWLKCHPASDNINIVEESRPNELLHGVIVYKKRYDNCDDKDKDIKYIEEAQLYIWDEKIISKFMLSIDLPPSINRFIGMQVVGRGFNIYAVGGSTQIGSEIFNLNILYYSLLTQKWYFQTKLQEPRRHMITVFIKNELVIVGGVTKFRKKTRSVDIYNIHTGKWKKGTLCPEEFTSVPPYCVINNKLVYLKSYIYFYHLGVDFWQCITCISSALCKAEILLAFNTTRLFLRDEILNTGNMPIWKMSIVNAHPSLENLENSITLPIIQEWYCKMMGNVLYRLRYSSSYMNLLTISTNTDKEFEVHLYTAINEGFENITVPKLNSFTVINPNTLYNTVTRK